jgi:hypothetical protein
VLLWVCTCTSSECFQWCLKIVDRKHKATVKDRTMSNRMALQALLPPSVVNFVGIVVSSGGNLQGYS